MCTVRRINLKTDCKDEREGRKKLMAYCLEGENQCLAIGWSDCARNALTIDDYYDNYMEYLKKAGGKANRTNPVINVFRNVGINDLFWTRDLNGYYWICRTIEKPRVLFCEELDIGAVLPVKAYRVGLEVPGQIKASFNRPRGGTCEELHYEIIREYSKYTYNNLCTKKEIPPYQVNIIQTENFLENLPDFELEELVISYLQLTQNYYVLSNSIAKKSTTIKIECELMGRDLKNPKKAVVQVKAKTIHASDYVAYAKNGFYVYLYAPIIDQTDNMPNNVIILKTEDLLEFYCSYKPILPESITKWQNLFE